MKVILRVFAYVRRYPFIAAAQLACAILGTLLVIVFPRLTREIMDVVIPRGQMDRLPGLIAAGARRLLRCRICSTRCASSSTTPSSRR